MRIAKTFSIASPLTPTLSRLRERGKHEAHRIVIDDRCEGGSYKDFYARLERTVGIALGCCRKMGVRNG